MYELMLTHNERMAIDWIGYRYGHGTDLYRQLAKGDWTPDVDWDSDEDILFCLPEQAASAIKGIGEGCRYGWYCFSPEFAQKMTDFCMSIV